MKTLLTTTLVLGTILMITNSQPAQAETVQDEAPTSSTGQIYLAHGGGGHGGGGHFHGGGGHWGGGRGWHHGGYGGWGWGVGPSIGIFDNGDCYPDPDGNLVCD